MRSSPARAAIAPGVSAFASHASIVATSALGGLLGGFVGASVVIAFAWALKGMLGVVSRQDTWVLIVVPMLGLGGSVLVLYGLGLDGGETTRDAQRRPRWARAWRTFRPEAGRADLTADMMDFAGEEERFPWRLAPIRMLAMVATVGLGAPLGTEKPSAYLGMAAGAALGDRGRWWRRLLRPAAVGGGAAGVSGLVGIPVVGAAYVLELGHKHGAPLDVERVTSALVGEAVGYLLNVVLHVDLFRLVVPEKPPDTFVQGAMAAVLVGSLAGTITSIAGEAIYRARKWLAHPVFRLALGALALGGSAVILAKIAAPAAAVGPGGGAIRWAEDTPHAAATTILAVTLLRAVATTSAVAGGGCGGLFVPFMAIGDLAGRVFAPGLGIPGDVAGSAGAASGIAGGYGLPFTAVVVVLGQGGHRLATLTCLAAVVVSALAGEGVAEATDRFVGVCTSAVAKRSHRH